MELAILKYFYEISFYIQDFKNYFISYFFRFKITLYHCICYRNWVQGNTKLKQIIKAYNIKNKIHELIVFNFYNKK